MVLQRYTAHPNCREDELRQHPLGAFVKFTDAVKLGDRVAAVEDAYVKKHDECDYLKAEVQNYKDRAFAWEGAYCKLRDLADAMAAAIEAERGKDYRGNPPQLSPDQLAALTAYREATK